MYTCICTGQRPLAGGAGQDQEREGMTLSSSSASARRSASTTRRRILPLDAGLPHSHHDDHLIIAQGGLHPQEVPFSPRTVIKETGTIRIPS